MLFALVIGIYRIIVYDIFLKSDIVSLKNTMSPQQKNISIIHSCEEHLFNWLKMKLVEHGISIPDEQSLSDILSTYENKLEFLRQHIKPIQKWNKVKDECYSLSAGLNGNAEHDDQLMVLIERAAFEGQVLWLTLQED